MDIYDDRFYGLTRRFMISVGLWPDQNPRHRQLLRVIISAIQTQGMIVQYMTFLTHQFSGKLFINVMSFNCMILVYLIKYHSIYLNSTNIKFLFEQINYDCIAITDSREMEIIQYYASRGRFYTIYSGLIVYLGTFFILSNVFVPDILNIIMPLDEPRLRTLPTSVEMFFDQQKYFYVIVSLIFIVALSGITTLMATETLFMVIIQHTCGLLAIASYRLSRAFNDCNDISAVKRNFSLAIRYHVRTLRIVELFNSYFAVSYSILAIIGVMSLSINMVRLSQAMEDNVIGEIISSAIFVLTHFGYVYWVTYFGQDLCDHSENLFEVTYSSRWYTTPAHIQKLLIFPLQISSRPCAFKLFGGLMMASMEGFASLTSLAVSYFTVLCSV